MYHNLRLRPMSTLSKPPPKALSATLARARKNNLRQLLLRSSRVLNNSIVNVLMRRGYDVRSTHTALLSNLDATGNTISKVAARAGMTKQAMGRIADELEGSGYIMSINDDADKRARILRFTPAGWKLMLTSFQALDAIERRCAIQIGEASLETLRGALQAFLASAESDSEPLDD